MTDRRIDRRRFLGLAGTLAGGAALTGCHGEEDPYDLERPDVPGADAFVRGEERFVATACSQCAAGCGTRVRVVEGRAVKIEGNVESPVNRGGIGPRGLSALQALYDPDRVRGPLRRAAKGGALEPIGWDEALALLASRLGELRERGAPERLALVCGRERGMVLELWRRFAAAYGTRNVFDGRDGADGVAALAVRRMQGGDEPPAYDWANARYVLSIGTGILDSSCQLVAFARAQQERRVGAAGGRSKVVHCGAWRSRTAQHADEFHPLLPGSGGALALGLCHLLVRDGKHDAAFVAEHATGFDAWTDAAGVAHGGFAAALADHAPEQVAQRTGIAPAELERIARELIAQKPSFVVAGPEELLLENGVSTALAVHALNALLGAIDRSGGLLTQRAAPLDPWPEVEPDEAAQAGLARARLDGVGAARPAAHGSVLDALPAALERGDVEVLLLHESNPAWSRPGAARWRAALAKAPFVVSFSPYLDETCATLADLVLPDSSALERYEDAAPAPSVGFPVFGVAQPAVATLHDTRPTADVVIALAKALGDPLAAAFPWDDFRAALLKRVVGLHKAKRGTIVADKGSEFLKRFWDAGSWSAPGYAYEQWSEVLVTPSARFDFAAALDAPWDARDQPLPAPPAARPLRLLAVRRGTYAKGGGANLPWLRLVEHEFRAGDGRTAVRLHPETARAAGVAEGDRVELESDHGRVQVLVRLDDGTARGLVVMPEGDGHTAFGRFARGRGANVMELLAAGACAGDSVAAPRSGFVSLRRIS